MRGLKLLALIALSGMLAGCSETILGPDPDQQAAMSQVNQWIERLDSQTTETGVYVRHDGEVLPEIDPWGKKLQVNYSRGGLAEIVKVTSAGPDGLFGNDDDIHEERQSANLAGVGTGLKSGAEEMASESAKGVVKGVVAGVKESLPKWGKKSDDARPDEAQPDEPERPDTE